MTPICLLAETIVVAKPMTNIKVARDEMKLFISNCNSNIHCNVDRRNPLPQSECCVKQFLTWTYLFVWSPGNPMEVCSILLYLSYKLTGRGEWRGQLGGFAFSVAEHRKSSTCRWNRCRENTLIPALICFPCESNRPTRTFICKDNKRQTMNCPLWWTGVSWASQFSHLADGTGWQRC